MESALIVTHTSQAAISAATLSITRRISLRLTAQPAKQAFSIILRLIVISPNVLPAKSPSSIALLATTLQSVRSALTSPSSTIEELARSAASTFPTAYNVPTTPFACSVQSVTTLPIMPLVVSPATRDNLALMQTSSRFVMSVNRLMALQIARFVKLVITNTKMDVKRAQFRSHTVPLVKAVTLVVVVRVDTIFLITFSVFSVTPLSVTVLNALRMVFVCSATQIAISTLRLIGVPNAVAWFLAVLAVLQTARVVSV